MFLILLCRSILGLIPYGNSYKYSGVVQIGSVLNLFVVFSAPSFGNYSIINTGDISVDKYSIPYNSSDVLQVLVPNVSLSIDVDTHTTRGVAYLSISAFNNDLYNKYYYIYGNLNGFGNVVPVYYNGLDPDSGAVIFNATYNTSGMGVGNYTVVFDGVYRDKYSVEYKLHLEKSFVSNGLGVANSSVPIPVISESNVSTPTTTAQPAVSTPTSTVIPNTPIVNDTSSSDSGKDIITLMIESLNKFLQSIFG